jgi:hypothetical protein
MKSRLGICRGTILGPLFILFMIWASSKEILSTRFADLDTSQLQDNAILADALDNANSVGQTFVAQKPYLSSIKLFFNSNQSEQNQKQKYHLFLLLQDEHHHEIVSRKYSVTITGESVPIDFSFTPQPGSLNKKFFLSIKTDSPTDHLAIWTSSYNGYPNGDAYLNEFPAKYDLAFWTYYKPPIGIWIAETLANAGPRFLKLLIISLLFFLLGFLILYLSGWIYTDIIEAIICSIAIGIITPPLLFLIAGLAGIKTNRITLFVFLAALILGCGIKYLLLKKYHMRVLHVSINYKEVLWLSLIFLLAALTRVSQINDLFVPNWVDGIVHQQIITRILERQGISFDTIYPKGFHANVIFEYLVFGGSLPECILLMGQWLSLMSGLTFYLLARNLLRTPYSLLATETYWFWPAFPAFLINWGRLPYLQSLVLLPVAVGILYKNSANLRPHLIVLSLLLLGIGLTYYGAFLIVLAFVITDVIRYFSRAEYAQALKKARSLAVMMLPIMLILVIRLNRALNAGIYGQASTTSLFEDSIRTFKISFSQGGWLIWILGISGFVCALIIKQRKFLLMAEWLLVLLSINFFQAAIKFTVSSIANSIIFLSIPLTLLAGLILRFALMRIFQPVKQLAYIVVGLIILAGAYNISGIIQPSTVLYSQADQKGMEWIVHNTSQNSVFLINSFLWGNDRAASDGGGWLTFIANRKSILYDVDKLENTLDNTNIDYVYLGRGYGDFNPDLIEEDSRFSLVYKNDGITIFKRTLYRRNP